MPRIRKPGFCSTWRAAGLAALVSGVYACSGDIAQEDSPLPRSGSFDPSNPVAGDDPVSSGGSGGSAGSQGGENPHGDDPGDSPDGVPLGTRLARLTHEQYDNTVRDLLGLDENKAAAFLADPIFAGYDNNAEALSVSGRLGRDYRRAAEELAAAVVADSGVYADVVGCDPGQSGCGRRFIEEFGLRAFRRPLDDEEIERYQSLHALGAELIGSGDAFRDGVQVALEAFLQSPSFLYRVELSDEVDGEGLIALDSYEIASRLSYTLWNTMPDQVLFERAAAGELQDEAAIAAEALRMLEDDRARRVVEDFHHQWLDLDHYRDLTKSESLYPEFQSDLSDALQQETLRFVDHVVFETEGGFDELLRAPYTFVNRDLAPLYDVAGNFGAELERVDLDPQTRGGVLTQIGFLASHAYTTNTSPIHRGVFVLRRVLCYPLPDPPGDADLTLPPIEGEIRTTRQQVETHTSPDACQSCHNIINPIGFAFERFDAIGRVRDQENGEPIDASGQVRLDGDAVAYQDAAEMLEAIASSDDARRCYATNWLRYAYGREDRESDTRTLDQLTEAIADPSYSVKALLIDLTQARAFRYRAPNTVYEP